MAETRVTAFTDREIADEFIRRRIALGDKVVEVNLTDVVQLSCPGEDPVAWESGRSSEWILVLATGDELQFYRAKS